MRVFSADHADGVWRQLAGALLEEDAASRVESRVGEVHELLHVGFTLTNPRQRWVVSRLPPLNPAFALAEVVWILAGRDDTEFLTHWFPDYPKYVGGEGKQHAAYGYRLRRHFGIDQLRRAYNALRNNAESRQVVLQIWSPGDDLPNDQGQPHTGDIPCNLTSCLKVRDGKLHWLQLMRSNDIDRGLPHNLVQFTTLQEVMAGWLGLQLGNYTHVIDSLHWYVEGSARMSIDETVTPQANDDQFDQPIDQSLEVFEQMASRVDMMIAARRQGKPVPDELGEDRLPRAFSNIGAVLAAEDARRAGDSERAAQLAADCRNPSLWQLWDRWVARVG